MTGPAEKTEVFPLQRVVTHAPVNGRKEPLTEAAQECDSSVAVSRRIRFQLRHASTQRVAVCSRDVTTRFDRSSSAEPRLRARRCSGMPSQPLTGVQALQEA